MSEDPSGQFLWYPQVARLANGELLAQIRLGGDTWQADLHCPIGFAWSGDHGTDWHGIDIITHHNTLATPDHVRFDGCSAYGSVITLADSRLLLIYDCFTDDEFGIYVVRADLT